MILPPKSPRLSNRAILGGCLILVLSPLVRAQELKALWNGRELRVTAPRLRFLAGKTLDQLRNGRAVAFDFQLSLHASGAVVKRALERFVISYDLWEERYAVTRLGERKSQSNLTQTAAESWCLDNLVMPTANVPPDKPVTVHLEVRADTSREPGPVITDPGISLTALIDIFSRPARLQQPKWNLQEGPLRLMDIRSKGL